MDYIGSLLNKQVNIGIIFEFVLYRTLIKQIVVCPAYE